MFKVNEDYLKLPGSYLFSTIGKKVAAFQEANPKQDIIRLGIGDVTQPLAPAIIDALHGAVDEMAHAETFHGYAPDLGYEFLRSAMAKNDYQDKGCDIKADEIFISDGAKCDSGNIQESLRVKRCQHSFAFFLTLSSFFLCLSRSCSFWISWRRQAAWVSVSFIIAPRLSIRFSNTSKTPISSGSRPNTASFFVPNHMQDICTSFPASSSM